MDDNCNIGEHSARDHWGPGCHKTSFLKGSCDCDFVQRPPLSANATAARYRERAEWWRARIRISDHQISRARYGSNRRRRLEVFRDNAGAAARGAQEMAVPKEATEARERAQREAARTLAAAAEETRSAEQQHGELLGKISIESIQGQPLYLLELLQEQFDDSPDEERQGVRAGVEQEFNGLEPSLRRELLEDASSRDFLEHIGVISRWPVSFGQRRDDAPPVDAAAAQREMGTPAWADDEMVRIATDPVVGRAFDEAVRETEAHMRFFQQLDEEYGDTIGDAYWAQTEVEASRLPRDEAFINEYRLTRSRVEAYWRNWAVAPSPQLQWAFMTRDPEGFKRQMTLAIQVLLPTEKLCFRSNGELFGWIASGMQPLIVDGQRLPLTDLVEPRFQNLA